MYFRLMMVLLGMEFAGCGGAGGQRANWAGSRNHCNADGSLRLAVLSLIEGEMMSAVKAVYRPTSSILLRSQAIFVTKDIKTEFATVRTFAQQVTHVAEANYFFYGTVSGLKPDADPHAILKAHEKGRRGGRARRLVSVRSVTRRSPCSRRPTRSRWLNRRSLVFKRAPHWRRLISPMPGSSTGRW